MEFNPNKRISAKEALEHPYFGSIGSPDSQDSGIAMSQEEATTDENTARPSSKQHAADNGESSCAEENSTEMSKSEGGEREERTGGVSVSVKRKRSDEYIEKQCKCLTR